MPRPGSSSIGLSSSRRAPLPASSAPPSSASSPVWPRWRWSCGRGSRCPRRTPSRGGAGARSSRVRSPLAARRRRKGDRRAASDLALDPDSAAVELDELARKGQPKPGALHLLDHARVTREDRLAIMARGKGQIDETTGAGALVVGALGSLLTWL